MAKKLRVPPPDPGTFGQRARWSRVHAGLTQAGLTARSGVGQSLISMIENDKFEESASTPDIAHACGVDAYWLKTGKGAPLAPPARLPDGPGDREMLFEFGARIRSLRLKKGMTEAEAGRPLLTAAEIRSLEAGGLWPGPMQLKLFCDRFRTSLNWLICGDTVDEYETVPPDPDLARRVHERPEGGYHRA